MAIYHIQASVIPRARGGSAVAAAAYRSGEKLMDERTGEQHDYSRRKALPRELDPEQRRELVREFAKDEFTGRGMVADVSYHDGNSGNPHAHILLTTRKLNSDGFGAKDRSWNDKELLLRWREQWAERANRTLDRAGSRERIDHRTLAEQRQEAIERGQGNERTRRNDRICAGNRDREQERGRLGRAIRAVDLQIKAQQLREAVSRGSAWASRKVKAGASRIAVIPQRVRDAAQERAQHRVAEEEARTRSKLEQERRATNWRAEWEWRAVESGKKNVNERDATGRTPLHYAADAGRKDIAEKLIERGAHDHDPHRDHAVATPASLAKAAGHSRMAEWMAEVEAVMEQSRAAFKERQKHQEKVITHGRDEFIRSLDPELSKEQTRSERELGQQWKKDNFSEGRSSERRMRRDRSRNPDYRGITGRRTDIRAVGAALTRSSFQVRSEPDGEDYTDKSKPRSFGPLE